MWTVSARNASGIWQTVGGAIEIPTDGPFRSVNAFVAAQEKDFPAQLLKYLETEAELPNQSRNAIETWAFEAQGESYEFDWAGAPRLFAIEESIALFPSDVTPWNSSVKPLTLAWHDHTAVLIPISEPFAEVRVEYQPGPDDEYRVERLRFRYATDEHSLETVFDWRGYFGTSSAILDEWTMMRQSGRGYSASFLGATGFVVGNVLRRLTKPALTLKDDPTARPRRISMESKYPQIAMNFPVLSESAPARHNRCVVFVHGTVSCGVTGLKDLFPPPAERPPLPGSVLRFEHDTFHNIDRNAEDLVSQITERIVTEHLLLAGHSRGGLVARGAADMLRIAGYQAEVSVYTFGTPHLGTPLIAMGNKALNLLFKLAEDFAPIAPLPVLSPLTKAYSYTVDVASLPAGINAMHEDSGDIRWLQRLVSPVNARSWASHFNVFGQVSGFGPAAQGLLRGALHGRPHDLVVPTDSGQAFGKAEPVLACSHVQYFLDPGVRTAVTEFLVPSAATPVVAE